MSESFFTHRRVPAAPISYRSFSWLCLSPRCSSPSWVLNASISYYWVSWSVSW